MWHVRCSGSVVSSFRVFSNSAPRPHDSGMPFLGHWENLSLPGLFINNSRLSGFWISDCTVLHLSLFLLYLFIYFFNLFCSELAVTFMVLSGIPGLFDFFSSLSFCLFSVCAFSFIIWQRLPQYAPRAWLPHGCLLHTANSHSSSWLSSFSLEVEELEVEKSWNDQKHMDWFKFKCRSPLAVDLLAFLQSWA